MPLLFLRPMEFQHGLLGNDNRPVEVVLVGVNVETLRSVSISEHVLVVQRCLEGFERAHFGRTQADRGEEEAAHSALRTVVRTVVDALHEAI